MKKEKKLNRRYLLVFVITLIGIILDQVSKLFIRYQFTNLSCVNCIADLMINGGAHNGFVIVPGKGIEIIKDFFYIINVNNTGGAWGIFSGNVTLLAIVSAIVVIILIFFLKKENELSKLSITYYSMLFAGIIGNLIDRVFNGFVTDFLNFYIFGYDYPVFNIADIFIVLGMILMIIDVVRGEIYAYQVRKRKCKD